MADILETRIEKEGTRQLPSCGSPQPGRIDTKPISQRKKSGNWITCVKIPITDLLSTLGRLWSTGRVVCWLFIR